MVKRAFAADFLTARTTWSGIGGIACIITSEFFKRPDLVAPITAIFVLLQQIFSRDASVRRIDALHDEMRSQQQP